MVAIEGENFSNSIREDGLLAVATAGIVYGIVGLCALDQRDEVANQFRSQQVHWWGRDFGEDDGTVMTDAHRLKTQ